MTNKTLFQGVITLVVFFGLWFSISRIDFVTIFKVRERSASIENNLGDMIWENIAQSENVVTNDSIVVALDKLLKPICEANNIERDSLKIHIVQKDEVNAFALPNNHLVVFTGLITDCKKQEALQGVLGHEIAHIQNNHVMKKLSKEIGLTVILAATTGGQGAEILKQILQTLSSSAYDRSLEKEADIVSVDYLLEANINPEPMADFMFELAQTEKMPDAFSWIASHPESEERAKYILEYIKGKKFKKQQTLSKEKWEIFQKQVKNEE